jgi:hypothetical protein
MMDDVRRSGTLARLKDRIAKLENRPVGAGAKPGTTASAALKGAVVGGRGARSGGNVGQPDHVFADPIAAD